MSDTTTLPITRSVGGVDVPAPGTYALDASHSEVGFAVKHLMVSKVRGRFSEVEGAVTIADDPADSSVEVTVQLASVDTRDAGRDEHLRSADFFDVENHPVMTYRSTAVHHLGANDWTVDGELSLAGVTQPLQLAVTFEGVAQDPWGGVRAGFSARGELNRDDFGISFNQALETGGFLVGKKVVLEIEAEAIRQ